MHERVGCLCQLIYPKRYNCKNEENGGNDRTSNHYTYKYSSGKIIVYIYTKTSDKNFTNIITL
jgi:hypothetical protein